MSRPSADIHAATYSCPHLQMFYSSPSKASEYSSYDSSSPSAFLLLHSHVHTCVIRTIYDTDIYSHKLCADSWSEALQSSGSLRSPRELKSLLRFISLCIRKMRARKKDRKREWESWRKKNRGKKRHSYTETNLLSRGISLMRGARDTNYGYTAAGGHCCLAPPKKLMAQGCKAIYPQIYIRQFPTNSVLRSSLFFLLKLSMNSTI